MEPTYIFTQDKLDQAVIKGLKEALEEVLPSALRDAQRSEHLSGKRVTAEYGLTPRQLTYMREKRRIEFTQHGRRILYKRASLDAWISEGNVARRITVPDQAGIVS